MEFVSSEEAKTKETISWTSWSEQVEGKQVATVGDTGCSDLDITWRRLYINLFILLNDLL
jgi:hypothetical protein